MSFRRTVFAILGLVCLMMGFSCGKGASTSKAAQDNTSSKSKPAKQERDKGELRFTRTPAALISPLKYVGTYDASKIKQPFGHRIQVKELLLANDGGKLTIDKVVWIEIYRETNTTIFIWERNGKQLFAFKDVKDLKCTDPFSGCPIQTTTGTTIATEQKNMKMHAYYKEDRGPENKPCWELIFTTYHPGLDNRNIVANYGVLVRESRYENDFIGKIMFCVPGVDIQSNKLINLENIGKDTDECQLIEFSYYYVAGRNAPPGRGSYQKGDMITTADPKVTGGRYNMKFTRFVDDLGKTTNVYRIETTKIQRWVTVKIDRNGVLSVSIH